jgi:D-amino-acid dehydrogenase
VTGGSPDVVVVGAGIVGACAAYELARAGAKVTVLERGAGWGEGCSWGNAGLLVPSHARPIAAPESLRAGLRWMVRRDSPFGMRPQPRLAPWLLRYARASTAARAAAGEALQRKLSVEGLARFDELAAEGIDGGYRRTGLLTVHGSGDGARHAAEEAESETGRALGARVLTAAEARELEPALTGAVRAAVLFPDEAQCDPIRLVADVAAAAERGGAELRPAADVGAIVQERGGVRVGNLRAGHAVIAAGVWSDRLAASLGSGLPLVAGKGYAVDYEPGVSSLRLPLYLYDDRCVANPMGSRLRLTGGLVLGRPEQRGDPRRVAAIRRVAARYVGVTAQPRLEWSGLRPCTPDGLPIVGAHPRADRVVLATGHGMLGVTLGPLTGRLVAGLVAGTADHPALPRLSPGRF